jgi:antimicrobial peptide system SdpA family protein
MSCPCPGPQVRAQRRAGAAFLLSASGAALLALYSAQPALPPNPLRLPFAQRMETGLLLPQGWKFFTRDPQEERILVFTRNRGGRWRPATLGPIARPANRFGVSRIPRAQGVETGLLMSRMSKRDWRDCATRPEECLRSAPAVRNLRNRSPRPTLCGAVGLVLQKPVPWAWSRADEEIVMPSRVARLEVLC